MTKRRVGRVLFITVLVVTAVSLAAAVVLYVGPIFGIRITPLQPTITQQQAEAQADQYIRDIVALLPGTPKLEPDGFPPVSACADPDDYGPQGRVEITRSYRVRYPWNEDPPNNTEIFNKLYAYWTGRGYHVLIDQHRDAGLRNLTVENPEDGFDMGITEGVGGQLSIDASSPCVWPNGTPEPQEGHWR